jgi:hypothetical protein
VVRQPALPLWRHVVFVDWHGVLSRSPYWSSIVTDPQHPLNRPLRSRLGRLYGDEQLMTEWMTGRRRTEDVVAGLDVELTGRYSLDYLCRQLERDCRSMRVNGQLLPVLQIVRERAFVVVASDNVDAFAATYRRLAGRREPAGPPAPERVETLTSCASAFDDLVCSSDVGVLKAADPDAFFGPYLAACGLGFGDALLIDDRSDVCTAFRAAGGTALRWTMHSDPLSAVVDTLRSWLDPRRDRPVVVPQRGPAAAGQVAPALPSRG